MRIGSFRSRLFVTVLFFFVAHRVLSAEEIEIGTVLQLSGDQSEWGLQARRGADLAVEMINERNLLPGRKFKLVHEDGRGIPSQSLSALRKLTAVNNIPAFITQASSVSVALGPVSNKNKIIQMDIGSTTPAYRTSKDFTFRTAVTAVQLASGLAGTVISMGIARCGHLYVNDDYGEGVKEVFSSEFKKLGGSVEIAQSFLPVETDFKPQLTRFRAAELPAVVITARYRILGTILKQARQLGLSCRFFGDAYSVESDQVINSAGKAVEGFTYTAPQLSDSKTAAEFRKRFVDRYGEIPVQLSAQAFDGVWALALSLKDCKVLAAECLRDKLESLSFEGASGFIEFDDYGDVKSRPVMVKVVKNGKFVVLKGE